MQTNSAETMGQTAALENLVPELVKFGQLLADARARKLRALHDFATDNPDLQRLEEMLAEAKAQPAEFDLFDLLNLWWQEDIHSRTLTWLLGPNNSHGIGDYFLKIFLAQLDLPDGICKARDWSNSEAQREWYCVVDGGGGWLDILVTNEDAKFACAIENKIFSPEGGRQLTHYRKALEAEYPDPNFTKRYVFLSPRGMESQWEDEREHWKPMNYTTILQLVEQAIEDKRAAMNKDVRSFLRQYAATLRRKIVPESNEIAELARKIYLENREAIELLIRHKPNYIEEMKQEFRVAIGDISGLSLDCEDSGFLRFRSLEWNDFEIQETGTGWLPRSSALILFQINFRDGAMNLPYFDVGLSPAADETFRRRLFDSAINKPGLFTLRDRSYRSGWIVLDAREYILEESDLKRWDDPSVRAKIHAWVKNFAENEFPAMNEVIVNCLREYEAETGG